MQLHRYGNRLAVCFGNTGQVVTLTEIANLAAGAESETVEFKKSTGTRNEAARTLSAMLNGAGGTVLIGVDDDGLVIGQQVSEKSLEDMTQACASIRPELPPTIQRVEVPDSGGQEVLAVSVPSGNSKPYAYKSDYYVRSGAATVAMPAETELALVLERAHGLDRWETAESRLGLEAIDVVEVETFRDAAMAGGRASFEPTASVDEVLLALNLLDDDGRPNRGAIALFGRREAFARHYAMLGCHLVAVDGTDLAEEFLDEKLVEDNAFALLRLAIIFCRGYLRTPLRIEGFEAESSLEIPEPVVREALANAFAHRSYTVSGHVQLRIYSDRLEIVSPGSLHFGLTPADLYASHSSLPWNPLILGALYRRGIVEQLGSGTLRMIRLCAEAGLSVPIFTSTPSAVTCNIPRRGHWLGPDGRGVAVSDVEAKALRAIVGNRVRRADLVDVLGIAESTARDLLARLRNRGLVHTEGRGRGATWSLGPSE